MTLQLYKKRLDKEAGCTTWLMNRYCRMIPRREWHHALGENDPTHETATGLVVKATNNPPLFVVLVLFLGPGNARVGIHGASSSLAKATGIPLLVEL